MADDPQKRCSSRSVASGGTLDLNGFNQTVSGVTNAGLPALTFVAPL
jgi:hypothetical protein